LKRSFIFLNPETQPTNQDLKNAVFLCKAISADPGFILESQGNLPKEIGDFIAENLSTSNNDLFENTNSIYSALDRLPLDEEILLVTTGSTRTLNHYCQERLKSEGKTNLRWNILSSDYARYSLMDKEKSLSEFIPVDTEIWITSLLSKFSELEIIQSLDFIGSVETIIVGEAIIDEYIYCEALGKVSKDPLVAFLKKESIMQSGGVLAAAKHFAGLGSTTTLLSELGQEELNWVSEDLETFRNLSHHLDSSSNSIIKRRYVDRTSNFRVFETYSLPQNFSTSNFEQKLSKVFERKDLSRINFVVMDYGHDLFTPDIVGKLMAADLNLSINAQSNAGNRGFNSIAKYRGAKNVFLNGSEVQLETRNKHADLADVVPEFASDLNFSEAYVTNGSRGIICWSKSDGQFLAPAFAPTIVDRTGAGDATLAVISALRAAGVSREIAAFYGNIAGALLVSTIGNSVSLTTETLLSEASEILRKVG
jgi:sugar/nucleoside kinase (ribokinase family)